MLKKQHQKKNADHMGRWAWLLCAAAAVLTTAASATPTWGSAQNSADVEAARRGGFLATGDNSKGWYKSQAVHVIRDGYDKQAWEQHAEDEREELGESALDHEAAVEDKREARYLKIGKLQAERKKAFAKYHASRAVLDELDQKADGHHAEEELEEDARREELGESDQDSSLSNAVQASAAKAESYIRELDALGKKKKAANKKMESEDASYGKEVGEDNQKDQLKMEAHAEKIEGTRGQQLAASAGKAQEKANEATFRDLVATYTVKQAEERMKSVARQADSKERTQIADEFKLGKIRAELLERQAGFMDADANRNNVENSYNRLNAGILRDEANDADPVVKSKANAVASREMRHLPNVQKAKTTVDANTHPCDAIDSLQKDALCSLKAAAVNAAQNDFESNTLHDGTDAPVELLEEHEGGNYNLGFVAKMRNDKVNGNMAAQVRAAALAVLDRAPTIDTVQLDAYDIAEQGTASNAASRAVQDTAEPVLESRAQSIMAGAQSMKRAAMASNNVEVSDAVYDNELRKQRGESDLDRSLRSQSTRSDMRGAMANDVLEQALKRRSPDIATYSNVESEIEAEKQSEAAQRVRRTNRMMQRGLNYQAAVKKRQRAQLADIMKIEHQQMIDTQQMVDSAYVNSIGEPGR